ncbi:ShlB/FhaC/HecB family hemolysin secretion/activation protein [Altericista sp. CCNU0014]|uniref:ShlB/FhaC/HecB family hemolysin secretion/activation protein n=1 Tax=Altericista sp. CCNU0014 TaxID=3082949 RepID=UPI003850F12D
MSGWCQDKRGGRSCQVLGLAAIAAGWSGSAAVAQVPPNPVPAIPPVPLPSELLPPPEDFLRLPPSPATPPSIDGTPAEKTITVRRFEILGSTLFSQEQLRAATAPFLNRPLAFADLLKARAAVTQLYLDRGYLTSGAYLPADREVVGGTVTIQIVEGSIEEIRVTGTKSLRPRYIRDRLRSATRTPLNVNRLTAALQLLKQEPLIERISAELLPGTQPGTNLLALSIVPAPSRSVRIGLNNYRSAISGELARQVRFTQTNLTGFGDRFSASYTNTDGSHEFGLSYTLPVNAKDGTVSVSYGQSNSSVIQQPFKIADIDSVSRNLTVAYRQPIVHTPKHQLAVGLSLSRQESELTFLDGLPLSLPESGSDARGRIRITELDLFQEWIQRHSRSLLVLRSDFGIGLDLGATQNLSAPDGRFFRWQGQAQWLYALRPDTILTLRSAIQLADRALPNPSLLGLGGNRALRGYPEGFYLFDRAVVSTAELSIPIFRSEGRTHALYVNPFIDIGYGWNDRKASSTEGRLLVSPGLGLRYEWRDRVGLQVNWGIPLVGISRDDIDPGLGDSRILFALDLKLF